MINCEKLRAKSILYQNYLALDAHHFRIAALLSPKLESLSQIESLFRFYPSVTGPIAGEISCDNSPVSLVSARDPVGHARRLAEAHYDATTHCFLLFGFGLGYLAEALLEKIKKTQSICIVEPSWSWFYQQLEVKNFSSLFSDKRVELVVSDLVTSLINRFRMVLWQRQWRTIKLELVIPYEHFFQNQYADFKSAVIHECQVLKKEREMFYYGTKKIKENFFIDGQMKNLSDFYDRIDAARIKRGLDDVEQAYLFSHKFIAFKSYNEKEVE